MNTLRLLNHYVMLCKSVFYLNKYFSVCANGTVKFSLQSIE
jgi:hypothetical protein